MTVLADHPPASDALRTIHDRYRPGLQTYLVKLTLGDVGLAEDLVQETFLRAWRHVTARADLDADTVLPWLYTVARRPPVAFRSCQSTRFRCS